MEGHVYGYGMKCRTKRCPAVFVEKANMFMCIISLRNQGLSKCQGLRCGVISVLEYEKRMDCCVLSAGGEMERRWLWYVGDGGEEVWVVVIWKWRWS